MQQADATSQRGDEPFGAAKPIGNVWSTANDRAGIFSAASEKMPALSNKGARCAASSIVRQLGTPYSLGRWVPDLPANSMNASNGQVRGHIQE